MPSHATARRKLRTGLFPVRLAGFRLGAGGERLALVALGIVAGAAALASVLGGRLVMQDEALSKAHGSTQVFSGLTASFAPGLLHVVTGPSGSGKTTLLHMLAGLELPDIGRVELAGHELTGLNREGRADVRRHSLAYVAQDGGLVPHLSALENVELALAIRELPADTTAARSLLTAVGLAERASQRVERLSHGERARVAIARALATRPTVLLADEPTARLDAANAVAVAALLLRLARETGAAVICATHDPLVVEQADAQVTLS